jgi:3D (Asp-Asp-Asp) domain-containing protein
MKLLKIVYTTFPLFLFSSFNITKFEINYKPNKELSEFVVYPEITRLATTYVPYEKLHTSKNGSHLIMAGGKKINPKNCYKKYIAISRDLKYLYPFGTIVEITNCGKLNGIYEVQDTKGPGYTHQIDILIPNKMYKKESFENCKIKIIKKGTGKYFKQI